MKKSILIEVLTALLILLFFYTSFSKLVDLPGFTRDMRMQPFPWMVQSILIWAVPLVEISIALLLLTERTRMVGLYAAFLLMGLFTLYTLAILLHFFSKVPCSCGGVIRRLTWPQHLVFTIGFTLIAWLAIFLKTGSYALFRKPQPHKISTA